MAQGALGRRGFLAGVAALAGGAMVSACSGGGETGNVDTATTSAAPTLGTAPATITVMFGADDSMKKFASSFSAAYPNVKVNLLEYDYSRLTAMIAGGQPPDLVKGLGVYDGAFTAVRGLSEPLDAYLRASKKIKESDLDPVNDLWRWDGSRQGQGPRYGITVDYSPDMMLWTNDALYEQAGLQPLPADRAVTYDDLLENARKLTRRSGKRVQVYGFGGLEDIGLPYVNQQVQTQGGTLFNADLTKVDFSSPAAQRSLQWFLDMHRAQVSGTPLAQYAEGWGGPVYQASRMATYMTGYWFQGMVSEKPDLARTSRLVPAPTFGDKRVSPTVAAVGFWIPRASKNKAAAWAFVEHWVGGEKEKQNALSGSGIPSLEPLRTLIPQDTPLRKQTYEAVQSELKYFGSAVNSPYVKLDAVETIMRQKYKDALVKNISAATLGQQLDETINALIADEKSKVA